MDPRVKPEDDNPKWSFLFVIPAGLKRESIKADEHFNFFTNEPKYSLLSGWANSHFAIGFVQGLFGKILNKLRSLFIRQR